MGLKLKSTGGTGSVELNAPDNHNINTSFTLPTSNFTGGEWVLADGSGNVNIDSGTLYVDAVNNRVGVGTNAPNNLLEVRGTSDGQNVLQLSNSAGTTDGSAENQVRVTCNGNNNWGNLDIQAYQTIFTQNGGEAVRIDSSGRFLVGTTSDTGVAKLTVQGYTGGPSGEAIISLRRDATPGAAGTTLGAINYYNSANSLGAQIFAASDGAWTNGSSHPTSLTFSTTKSGSASPTERMRISNAGEVKIGGNIPQNYGQAYGYMLAVQGPTSAAQTFISIPAPGQTADSQGLIIGTDINSSLIWQRDAKYLGFGTNNAERMRIHSTGYMNAGGFLGSSAYHRINGINATENTAIVNISGYQSSGGSSQDTAYFFSCGDSAQPSSSAAAVKVFRISSTSRSINAAGTINASGADYAEYMFKAGDFTIAKGDVCGINVEGKLTNVFADAISFAVKSTNPSYVGGDTWHLNAGEAPGGYDDDRTEEEIAAAKIVYEQELEAARQMVDRIAFSGQVPVNVTGTTPGQYIVPAETADGGIEGVAKNEADLTLAEYMRAVGKVIAIEDDGRARIIVKVA